MSKANNKKKPGLLSSLNCASGKSKKTQSVPLSAARPGSPPLSPSSYADDPEVSHEVITVNATPGYGTEGEEEVSYTDIKVIGKGTFGVVYRAKLCTTGEMVAIKKVYHNEKFKNRELQMLKQLQHPNIITLHYFFYSNRPGCRKDELYLNMVMEFIPETLWSIAQCDGMSKPLVDTLYVKLYMYQLFRCLVYLHSLGICHRDIKPQNLLLNPASHVIKLCDFGSAKELRKGETNVAYICSRYYRAPELILGTTDYTLQIDVWSSGCVLAELLLGQPVFPGATAADQLVEIIKILGTPTTDDFQEINRNFQNFSFPHLRAQDWSRVLNKHTTTPEAVDLVSRVLVYLPSSRLTAVEVIAHPFFDELRQPHARLRHNKRLPPLFNFTSEELGVRPDLNDRLIPEHIRNHDQSADFIEVDNLNLHGDVEVQPRRASLLGKFRSSLKNKVSLKNLSIGSKKEKKVVVQQGETEQVDNDHVEDDHVEDDADETENRYAHDASGSIDIETVQDTEEVPVPDEVDEVPETPVDVHDGAAAAGKKKKKKKKRIQQQDDGEPTEEDYRSGPSAQANLTQSMDASGYDTDDIENNGHVSINHHIEHIEQHEDENGKITVVVTKTKRTKKHRQRTHVRVVDDDEPQEL